jgi:hypothetical protein
MGRSNEVGKHKTSIVHTSRGIGVQYHDTLVVRKEGNVIVLNSGGWKTNTTKLRMNQFAQYCCGGAFGVYQYHYEWYVRNNVTHETAPFEDGMQFSIAERREEDDHAVQTG